jgi:RNA polymerase primary sigma factor
MDPHLNPSSHLVPRSTYAYFYIHKNIAAAAADYSSVAITGPTERQALKDLQRAEQALMKQLDDAPTASEMATALNWPVEKVLDMWRRGRPLQSMESGVYNTALHGVGDTLADPAPWSVEADASAADLQEAVLRSVSKLGEEERMVLVYRLGLVDGQRRSWDELLKLMGGRTVAYLRKVESRAKKQLMRDMEFCKLAERLAPLELELV